MSQIIFLVIVYYIFKATIKPIKHIFKAIFKTTLKALNGFWKYVVMPAIEEHKESQAEKKKRQQELELEYMKKTINGEEKTIGAKAIGTTMFMRWLTKMGAIGYIIYTIKGVIL